ncbi:MAG: DUF4139 domain-containing protein [Phycisphaeraceae bacterium]|nr:DUF4139 domain-containing protein [Phycisphaeraceae bacterium]
MARTSHRTRTRLARTTPLALVLLSGLAPAAHAQQDEAPTTSLTIYSTAVPGAIPASMYRPVPESLQFFSGSPSGRYYGQQGLPGYAVVRQDRTINLAEGRSITSFNDVAALLDPTTVTFTSLTHPADTKVVEQNYQFDLVSTQKMLERFTGKPVVLDGKEVTLLSANTGGGILVKDADGSVRWQNGYGAISFPGVADGLITQPTLIWDIYTTKPGDHRTRVSYQTEGITWWADYNIIYRETGAMNQGELDINAWVSILNQSGADYQNASLKLVAGDVHRAPQGGGVPVPMMSRRELAMADAAPAGFAEKSFFEYHLYTLGRPTTIPQASTKQIELFDAPRNVPCEKVLVYYGVDQSWRPYWSAPAIDRDLGIPSNTKVDVYLTFKNTKDNGMGMPLPSGRVRVSKTDPDDGSLEFIGEDVIDHTAKDETILLKLGNSFDVVGERRSMDFRVDLSQKWMDETIEIKLRNRKQEPVKVIIRESMYRWTQWDITESSLPFEKQDSRTIHIPITLKADQEAVVRYKVRYTW